MKSQTNYGDVVHVVNAIDETDVVNIVKNNNEVWGGYEIELLDTTTRGIVASGGGDF